MPTVNSSGSVLLIADNEEAGRHYTGALEAAGYQVTQIETFAKVIGSQLPEPDVIVLCDLAVLAYPGQAAPVVRVPKKMTPDELVTAVCRRVGLRATLLSTAAQPA